MIRYAELHCHTNFSFLDGASHPHELVTTAADLGYSALAVTDHHGFYGAVHFSAAAKEVELPTVYGTEIIVTDASNGLDPFEQAEQQDEQNWARLKGGSRVDRRGRSKRMHGTKPAGLQQGNHLVLLAKGPEGYSDIGYLVSKAQLRGKKNRPTYTWEDLSATAQGGNVLALTGCWQGAVPRAAQQRNVPKALREARKLQEIFEENLFIELWDHRMPEDDYRNHALWEVSQRLSIAAVATNNVHYHQRDQANVSEVVAAIAGRRSLEEQNGFNPGSDERFLKTPQLMEARFRRYPGVVEQAADIAEEIAFDLHVVAPGLPDFPMPAHYQDETAFLRHLTYEGARKIYSDGSGGIDSRAKRRLDHELDVIGRLNFAGYFLVVWDLVQFARQRDILCQIRGSGADSAVCRCIGLTQVDPIRLNLPFERFLSEERGRAPDIDLDLEADRREEVIQYCFRRYGRERAAMVANVITYRAKSVLRDVVKTFGFSQAQADGLSKYLDTYSAEKIAEMEPLPNGLTANFVYEICQRLDGFPRHLGIHSGGVVIADRPLWQVVPLEWGRMEGRSVLQWDKESCGMIGVVKFDLLGLGMLNALHLTVDAIQDVHGVTVDLGALPQEPAIYGQLTKADTVGLFQVESRAQMATLPKMKPKTFYDLAVEVALIRPGPIQGHSVHPYLRRRNGEEPVRYPHPLSEGILAKTLGVPIFQEQLMELARVCAGFSAAQVDRLRQAMTHKRSEQAMEKLRDDVFSGMTAMGVVGDAAAEIWEKLQGFGQFGFPESHSVSFAYIVYMSAWLRFHYPTEFLVGLLNAQPMGFYSPNSLVQDSKRHGVVVLGPDVNISRHDATVEPHQTEPTVVTYLGMSWEQGRGALGDAPRQPVALRMGLRSVRGLGETEVTRIEAARIIDGPFTAPEDLAHRTGLNVTALEALAVSGAMESVGLGRREGLWAAGALAEIRPDRLALTPGVEAPMLPGLEPEEEARLERWATGVSMTHPVSFMRGRLSSDGCLSCMEAVELQQHGKRVRVGGIVTHRQRSQTARGIIFFNLEDETGLLNVVVFPDVWAQHRDVARKNPGLTVEGTLEYNDGVTNLVARRFHPWPVAEVTSRNFR